MQSSGECIVEGRKACHSGRPPWKRRTAIQLIRRRMKAAETVMPVPDVEAARMPTSR